MAEVSQPVALKVRIARAVSGLHDRANGLGPTPRVLHDLQA